MSAGTPALLVAAAGVAVGHAVLPDHWLPLAVLGRTRNYPLRRVARISGLAGLAHVLVSILLGAAIIVVGLQFRSAFQSAQDAIVGALLIGTGVAFVLVELTGHGHTHVHGHDGAGGPHAAHGAHPHHHHQPRRIAGLAAVMVPFGAAASPDLTILPVFLAATTVGVATAIGSVLVFAFVTVATIVTLTLTAARGGYEVRGLWLERWGNTFTAAVLVAIGVLVFAGVI
jgi:nickel/cobalt transporter (NicO) family protein